jgi:hypothetical protein
MTHSSALMKLDTPKSQNANVAFFASKNANVAVS